MDVIRIEQRCNQSCLFCGADPDNRPDYTLNMENLKAKILEAGKGEIVEISGGEPTLSPMLPELLLFARSKGVEISLQTNGMRFSDPSFTGAMKRSGLRRAFVSLHAPVAGLSDAITRRPGGFELTVAGIRNLLEARIMVTLNYVICRPNAGRMVDFVTFVHREFKTGADLVFSFINPFFQAWAWPRLIPEISEIRDGLHEALELGEKLGLIVRVPDICGIPLCFLLDRERFSDKYRDITEGRSFKPHPEKRKAPACEACVWFDCCDGLWERYIERYGSDELAAVNRRP